MVAKNGSEGLKMATEDKFDLVLTDLKMPDMDGIEVLRSIKEKSPDTIVIIVTGYQTVDTAVNAIKYGAYDYIEKPFTPDALISSVEFALASRQK